MAGKNSRKCTFGAKMKKIWHFLQILVWTIALNGHLDKFRTWISLHLPKEAFNALRKYNLQSERTFGTPFKPALNDLK